MFENLTQSSSGHLANTCRVAKKTGVNNLGVKGKTVLSTILRVLVGQCIQNSCRQDN